MRFFIEHILFEIWEWKCVGHDNIQAQNVKFRVNAVILIIWIFVFKPSKIEALKTLRIKSTQISKENTKQNNCSKNIRIILYNTQLLPLMSKLVDSKIQNRWNTPKAHYISYLLFDIKLIMFYLWQFLIKKVKIGNFKPVNE